MGYKYIVKNEDMSSTILRLEKASLLYLDTEIAFPKKVSLQVELPHVGESHYVPDFGSPLGMMRLLSLSDGAPSEDGAVPVFLFDLFALKKGGADLAPLFKLVAEKPVVCQNYAFDGCWLLKTSGRMPHVVFDTMIASQLADAWRAGYNAKPPFGISSSLAALVERHLGRKRQDKEIQKENWNLDPLPEAFLEYAAQDVLDLVELFPKLRDGLKRPLVLNAGVKVQVNCDENIKKLLPQIDASVREALPEYAAAFGLREAWATIEMAFVPVMAELRFHGLGVDEKAARSLLTKQETDLASLAGKIREVSNTPLNPESPLVVRNSLSLLHFRLPPTEKGNPSVGKKVLEKIVACAILLKDEKSSEPSFIRKMLEGLKLSGIFYNPSRQRVEGVDSPSAWPQWALDDFARDLLLAAPLCDAVIQHRSATSQKADLDKLIREHIKEGRVFGDFRQLGTAPGRMSCSKPNLQNPRRDEAWRALYCSGVSRALFAGDFPQIQLRIAARSAPDATLFKQFEMGEDPHRAIAAKMTGKNAQDISKEERRGGKAVNFGRLFGMGDTRLVQYARDEFKVTLTLDQAGKAGLEYFGMYRGIQSMHFSVRDLVRACEANQGVPSRFGGSVPTGENGKPASIRPAKKVQIERMTLFGRPVMVDEFPGALFSECLNYPIIGTEADLVKLASALFLMRRSARGLTAFIVNIVHDEILAEGSISQSGEIQKALAESMASAARCCTVPLRAAEIDVGIGPNWASAESSTKPAAAKPGASVKSEAKPTLSPSLSAEANERVLKDLKMSLNCIPGGDSAPEPSAHAATAGPSQAPKPSPQTLHPPLSAPNTSQPLPVILSTDGKFTSHVASMFQNIIVTCKSIREKMNHDPQSPYVSLLRTNNHLTGVILADHRALDLFLANEFSLQQASGLEVVICNKQSEMLLVLDPGGKRVRLMQEDFGFSFLEWFRRHKWPLVFEMPLRHERDITFSATTPGSEPLRMLPVPLGWPPQGTAWVGRPITPSAGKTLAEMSQGNSPEQKPKQTSKGAAPKGPLKTVEKRGVDFFNHLDLLSITENLIDSLDESVMCSHPDCGEPLSSDGEMRVHSDYVGVKCLDCRRVTKISFQELASWLEDNARGA